MTDQIQSPDELLAAQWAEALGQQEQEASQPAAEPRGRREAGVARAPLEDLQAEPAAAPREVNLDAILDIPVNLSMEIGRTRINIRHLLQLNQGSVVELDRLAGEPLDVLVNGTLIAHGEVVVVNEKFGIRLTDVVSAHERVQKLR
jgi:flagellar motor switch protein FliN/FliY